MDVTPATWAALSTLLDEALELDAVKRSEWLQRLAATQPALVPPLSRLLAAHAISETADVLARLPQLAAPVPGVAEASGLAVGELIGPYRLTRSIGSGGMAEVWLAERADGAFEREVALKLPRLALLRPDLAARFGHERDILARLEHPHIARFYDAGVSVDGLPYLAMEYVAGRPLIPWCDERRLTIGERLALFAQVLDAVQFAHANLIIHRDLKPSNILVTADGQVRLLDFGIAKLLSDGESARETRLTQFAGRALTPDYASPEQIKGEPLTIASDVYSLGVVLYELLTGELPYRLKLQSVAQLEEAIVSAEPSRPSRAVTAAGALARGMSGTRLSHGLRGDLDTIVLKALAKGPAGRYATVAEFAEDLQRHLSGQTVQARPASWGYRTRKFISRNRLAVAAATAVTAALIAATAVSLWQAQRAREQAARAEEVKNFVVSFFQDADVGAGTATRQTTAVDLLKQARARLDDAPIADQAIRAELLTTIGSGLFSFGELELAEPALAEATRLVNPKASDQDRITAEAQVIYGSLLHAKGKMDLAEQQLLAAQERSRRSGDMEHLAGALHQLSFMRHTEGQYDKAVDLAWQSVRAAEQLKPSPRFTSELSVLYADLSNLTRLANRKGSLEPGRRAYALARQVYADRATDTLLYARTSYAAALGDEGDVTEGLSEMQAVLHKQQEILGPDNLQVEQTFGRLGGLWLKAGDPLSAIASLKEALRISILQSDGKPTSALAICRLNLGVMYANAHRYNEALDEWRAADRAYSSMVGADSENARMARSGVALALTRLGRFDEADAIFAPLLAQPFHGPSEELLIKGRLGVLRSAQGRHEEALALLRGVPDSLANSPDRTRALALAALGDALLAGGRFAQALEVLSPARAVLLRSQRNGSPDLADTSLGIARAQLALGHPAEAAAASAEAVAFWDRFDRNHRDSGLTLIWHARALAAAGRVAEAAEVVARARAVLAVAGRPGDEALLNEAQRAAHMMPSALRQPSHRPAVPSGAAEPALTGGSLNRS
ncbi:MAG TPA: serine/threonine-protein kinase [Steroidobacteraceae bacterium]